MRRSKLVTLALIVGTGLAAWGIRPTPSASGEERTALEPGFRRIFNGKNLTGWHKNPAKIGHGTGGSWTVVDGAITGEQDPPGSGNGGIIL
ncbi:MAG TPA: family 16 glycoside hydrolase, partial [Planctomycetaceae bacterium]|nr:family 16 glycoside hydrolase [Planctomycetaceae bacterium]